jgi:hypothetical protein
LTYSAIFGLGYAAFLGTWFGLAGALVFGPTVEFGGAAPAVQGAGNRDPLLVDLS